jgi:hypothetical protein
LRKVPGCLIHKFHYGHFSGVSSRVKVKLTFAKGASLKDPTRLFNSSLEGNTRRAIDIHEGEEIDADAFKALVTAAVAQNAKKAKSWTCSIHSRIRLAKRYRPTKNPRSSRGFYQRRAVRALLRLERVGDIDDVPAARDTPCQAGLTGWPRMTPNLPCRTSSR